MTDIRARSKKRRENEKRARLKEELNAISEEIEKISSVKIRLKTSERPAGKLYKISKDNQEIVFFTRVKGWAGTEKERILQMKVVLALELPSLLKGRDIGIREAITKIVFR